MATIKFLLKKKKNPEGRCPIYIAIYDKDDTELISTKRFIEENLWGDGGVKQIKNLPEYAKTIQSDIAGIMRKVTKIQASFRLDDVEPTGYQIRQEYKKQQKDKEAKERGNDAVSRQGGKLVKQLIEVWQASLTYQPLTKKAVKNSMDKFIEFLKVAGFPALEVKDITRELIAEYEIWLLEKKKLADASHGRHIKHLRWFLRTLKLPFNVRDEIKLRTYTRPIIALTMDELSRLEKVDVSFSRELQQAKDMFLLGCYLGLRISDLKRISRATIQEHEVRLTTLKNNREVSIPILPETAAILMRYDQKAPRITEQDLNKSIKVVCDKAGINSQFQITIKKGGKTIHKDIPKYKLISSHIAGKTFITLARAKWGLDPAEIASIVGKNIQTLLKHYFRNDNDTAKQKMLANYKPTMAANHD